jgi:hypothetical protein
VNSTTWRLFESVIYESNKSAEEEEKRQDANIVRVQYFRLKLKHHSAIC